MSKRNQDGGIGIILLITLLVAMLGGAIGFGAWAYSGRQTYKTNVDGQIAVAVAKAKQVQQATDNVQYEQESKQPLRAYDGPEAYGSLVVNYPKTWSGYVDDTGTGSSLINGFFASGTVPATQASSSIFSLRIQLLSQSYSQIVQNFQGQEQAKQVTSIKAYALPKVPQVVGVEVTGALGNNANGTMVVLPLRSNTLEIYTEGTQYLSDFNTFILPNLSFSP